MKESGCHGWCARALEVVHTSHSQQADFSRDSVALRRAPRRRCDNP
jgi:hypothetical protein